MNNQPAAGELPRRKPAWLKARTIHGEAASGVRNLLRELKLHTVCEEAGCPNCGECFGRRTAAFLILGGICTRSCRFCQVGKGCPEPLDPDEPENLARAVASLELAHVVVTSVTRDDLPDGGAAHFAATVRAIRTICHQTEPIIEVLIPDFAGSEASLRLVAEARPDILNHNIETVSRLYPDVRPQAIYRRSLDLLRRAKSLDPSLVTKSGLMVGLGETPEEVIALMNDLKLQDCSLLTIGQYLAPSRAHYPVQEYIHPDMFEFYRREAEKIGFAAVASGPLVRSSYMADQLHQAGLGSKE